MIFASPRKALLAVVAVGWALLEGVEAKDLSGVGNTLYTSSVTYCSPPTGILVSDFGFQYYKKNNSAYFTLSAASISSNLNLAANIQVDAYGISALNWTINTCDILNGVLCPLPKINFTGGSALPVPSDLTNSLPSIAYTVPDLSAYAEVRFTDVTTGDLVACIQATLSNGWTTRIPAVLWATAGFALLAVFVSWFHTAWNISRSDPRLKDRAELVTGSSSPGQWRVVDVIFLFQSIAATGLISLEFPTVYTAFVLNFQWALGIFSTLKIQNAIDRARAMTGGSLTSQAYPETAFINRKTTYTAPIGGVTSVSVPTFSGYVIPLVKRLEDLLTPSTYEYQPHLNSLSLSPRATVPSESASNSTTQLPAGIPVYVNSLNVPVANAWFTIFFTWLFIWLVFAGVHLILYLVVLVTTSGGKKVTWKGEKQVVAGEGWAWRLRKNFGLLVVTNILRMNLMLFFPVAIFAMYQFTLNDAWLPIFLGAIVLFITLATLLGAEGTLLLASRRSHSSVPTTRASHYDGASRRASLSSPASPVDSDLTTSSETLVSHHKSMFSPFPTFRPLCAALYQQYRRPMHSFWLLPLLFSTFAKACFIAFAQGHGHVQLIGLVVIEGLTLILLVAFRPHTNKKGDWLSATLSVFRLVAMGLMFAFFESFNATGIIKTVIGLVIVAVWGFAVILLLFGVIYNLFWGVLWKRHTPSAPMDVEDEVDMREGQLPDVMGEKPDSRRLSSLSDFQQGDVSTDSRDRLYPVGFTPISEDEERQRYATKSDSTSSSNDHPPFLIEANRRPTSYILEEEDLAPSIPPYVGTPVPLAYEQQQRPTSMGPPASRSAGAAANQDMRRQSYPAPAPLQSYPTSGGGSDFALAPPLPGFIAGGVPTFTPSGQTPYYDAAEETPRAGGATPMGTGRPIQDGGYFGRAV